MATLQTVVEQAARFLVDHAGERIVLADVADHVGYSPFHLARAFQRHLNMAPGQLLAAHRFRLAKELLLDSEMRVIDVCFAVGFSSVGTFTARFTSAVGSSPTEFRRLPHVLADSPPRPVIVPGGARGGGVVVGSARLSADAAAVLGAAPSLYVGLFTRRAAQGFPVSGTMVAEAGDFVLTDVPAGSYWLLASALASGEDPHAQLLPDHSVVGSSPLPVHVHVHASASARSAVCRRDLLLDVAEQWRPPVLVALSALASKGAQDRRRLRWGTGVA